MATSTVYSAAELRNLSIHAIARIIEQDWPKMAKAIGEGELGMGQHPANPYWQAMKELSTMDDWYGYDKAPRIVNYFLGAAASWKGPQARLVKAELKRRVKEARGY